MLSILLLVASVTPTLSPLLPIDSDDLQHFFFIEVLEPSRRDYFLMVLLCEKKACLFKSLAIKVVCIFEDLADAVNADMLSKDVLALSLDRLDVVAVGKLNRL